MTYTLSGGTLNPTHSLTLWLRTDWMAVLTPSFVCHASLQVSTDTLSLQTCC